MKHKFFGKTYSEYRSDSKKTIAKWLKLYLKEKNPWYIKNEGLCMNDELIEKEDGFSKKNNPKNRYNSLDSTEQASIRREAQTQIIKRIDYLFDMKFSKDKKISKELWKIFISIFFEVKKNTDGKNGMKMLKEKKYEIVPQKIRDKIVQFSKKKSELSKLIDKYSEHHALMEDFGYELNTMQVVEEEFDEPIKSRLIQDIETLFFDYRQMCDVKDKITEVCDREISQITKKTVKNCTPENLLKLYTQLPDEEQSDETISWIKRLIYHKNMINKKCYEVDRQITKIIKELGIATKELEEFLSETVIDEDYDTYGRIAIKRMIEKNL